MTKPKGYWNYDTCYEEAKKYKTRTEFARKSPGCYEKAQFNGWIDDYYWIPKYEAKPKGYWNNYQKCYDAAYTCLTRTEFAKNFSTAYKISIKNNWINDFNWFKNGVETRTEKLTLYTEQKCKKIALQFKSKKEFRETNESCYNRACKFGWIDNYNWLQDERFDLFKDKIDLVYAYEFVEQHTVYIGRTLMRTKKRRDYQHIFGNDSVSKFAKDNNISVPEMKILEDNLTIKEGAENEGIWIELYREDGWNILNKAKAGSIGGLGKGKSRYTYEICLKLSTTCNDKAEFKKNHPQAYCISFKNKWLDKFDFKDGKIVGADKRRKYDYQTCYEEAKKYNTITEFENGSKGACVASRANGWMKDYTWFTLLWQEKWNKESCYEEAKKYSTLEDFMSKSNSCYSTACKNKWIDDYTWLERKRTRRGYWQNYDNCYNEAKKYNSMSDFMRKSNGAYNSARKKGWTKDYIWLNKK